MKNPKYDFEKENDKDFLREAGKVLLEKVVKLEIRVAQLELQKTQDEEIKSKLTGELLILRRMIFESKQEKKEKLKDFKKIKKKKKVNLIHNQNENKKDLQSQAATKATLLTDEIEHELDTKVCPHCGVDGVDELHNLFDESSEIDISNTYYILKRHKRKKYKCGSCKKITTAKGGEKLTPGGQFSIQLATQVACDKFEYHIPLERQRSKMEMEGLSVSVKTLFSMTQHLYNILIPLEEMNREDVIHGEYICMDESPMDFFNKTKSRGHVWSISNSRGASYQFEPSRSSAVAKEMISGFKGVVVTDGYSGYDFLKLMEGIDHGYCWSHMRRYFFDAMMESDRTGEVVDLIDKLYEVEHEALDLTDLKYLRETRSTKIYNDIKAWIEENDSRHLPSTLTGKAISYYHNQRVGLEQFLKNENCPIDNNTSERSQRNPIMGRNNYLFFRSIDGADIAMFFYSLIVSCKINGLNPSAFLQEMALRGIRGEKLESPYRYASKLRADICQKLNGKISDLKQNPTPS